MTGPDGRDDRRAAPRAPEWDRVDYRADRGGLTRREALIGAGALVAAGAAGVVWAEHARVEHVVERLIAARQGGHVPPASDATVVYKTFSSQVLGTGVDYGLAWPPGVDPGTPLPVAFCLPGRGGDPRSVFDGLHLPDFLAQAVSRGARRFALAAVAGGQSYWHRRASGEDRLAMLVDEFVPLCRHQYKLGGGKGRQAGMGWSMGGYGVLLAAETYPRLFSSVTAGAPAVWPTYQDMMNGPGDAFDSAADFALHDVIGHAARLNGTPARIDCGTVDPFYPFVKQLAARLPAGDVVHYAFGGHTPAFWRSVALQQLRFVARHFGRG